MTYAAALFDTAVALFEPRLGRAPNGSPVLRLTTSLLMSQLRQQARPSPTRPTRAAGPAACSCQDQFVSTLVVANQVPATHASQEYPPLLRAAGDYLIAVGQPHWPPRPVELATTSPDGQHGEAGLDIEA